MASANGHRQALPPSTLAAQLAESHASAGRHEQPENLQALHQLLTEIRNSPDSLEADVASNHTLISVIANAALVLSPADPSCHARVAAGLEAIAISFDRNPAVLVHAPPPGPAVTSDPLCLVLFPRLFSLLSGAVDADIFQSASRLLSHFVAALSDNFLQRSDSHAIQELLIGSADAAVCLVENSTTTNRPFPASLVLPPDNARARAFPLHQSSVTVNDSSRIRLPDLSAGLALACGLGSACIALETLPAEALGTVISPAIYFRCCQVATRSLAVAVHTIKSGNGPDLSLALSSIITLAGDLLQASQARELEKPLRRHVNLLAVKVSVFVLTLQEWPAQVQSQRPLEAFLQSATSLAKCSKPFQHALGLALAQHAFEDIAAGIKASCPQLEPLINQLVATAALASSPQMSQQKEFDTAERPLKRSRIGDVSEERYAALKDVSSSLISELCALLGNWNPNEIASLPRDVEQLFSDLSHEQKLQTLGLLGSICCGTRKAAHPVQHANGASVCPFCGSASRQQNLWNTAQWTAFYSIMSALSKSSCVQSSKEYRVMFAMALRRFACHVPDRSFLELEQGRSPLGTWCLHSLRSSFRELRQVAAHVLPYFCMSTSKFPDAICQKNRRLALQYLREMSETKEHTLAETIVTTLSNLAKTGGDEEVNLILLQLVDFLGHTNPLICSSAQLSLRQIADERACEIGQLIAPFWESIAIQMVKDLPAQPQKVQQLADLLGAPVNLLLLNTQTYTVPYLILWKNTEALQRIAQARSEDASVWSLCMNKKNMNPTIARILVEHPTNAEAAIADCLSAAHHDFSSQDPVDLVKSDPIALACEILKIAADRDGEQCERALQGFKELAAIIERRGHSTRTTTTQARMTAIFFENHSLGIMQLFSDCIDNSNESWAAKKRCLRAMHRMVQVGRNAMSIALPQVRSCLQSALEVLELRNEAFSTWLAVVGALDEDEDLENLVENTFVIITQNWDDLDSRNQQQAYDTVGNLVRDHQDLIRTLIELLPSFGPIPMMSKYENQINRLKDKIDPAHKLSAFTLRIKNENTSVVVQALQELSYYLDAQQQWIHNSTTSEQPEETIVHLLRALLDVLSTLGRNSEEIARLSTKCLGFIGAVDPNRIEAAREKHDLIVLSNFDQAEDAVEFVAHVLEHVLVKAFHSVTNPRAQGFLAYTMQEMLRFCGFSKEALMAYRPQGTQMDELHTRWMNFSESVRNTLSPFLSSKYVLTTRQNPDPTTIAFPTFSLDKPYLTWVRELAFNLMLRATGVNAKEIFRALRRVVRGYDASIAAFLLPYAITNVVIGGSEADARDIITEILAILDASPRTETRTSDLENLKQCSECIFKVLDYLSKWLHEKRNFVSAAKTMAVRSGRPIPEAEAQADQEKISRVDQVLKLIPAQKISERALVCKSYARALRHWEEHIRQEHGQVAPVQDKEPDPAIFQHLHSIYSQIDEPDGLEGIAVNMPPAQEQPLQIVLNHQKAGRWSAAESWFEHFLKMQPGKRHIHEDLVTCLSRSGKHFAILDHVKALSGTDIIKSSRILADASEAAWRTFRWDDLAMFNDQLPTSPINNFKQGLSQVLLSYKSNDEDKTLSAIDELRLFIARTMTPGSTNSIQASRDQLLCLQALNEVELILGSNQAVAREPQAINFLLNKRLNVVGSYAADKQFLLGIRRAAMELTPSDKFGITSIGQLWLTTAQLARKGGDFDIAHGAAIEANKLGAPEAPIELARYLWNQGEHRKAIHSLRSLIDSGALQDSHNDVVVQDVGSVASAAATASHFTTEDKQKLQNLNLARAYLLLAKWLDRAGQTQSQDLNAQYQKAANAFHRWEKGYYHLGRFYNKLLEAEKAMPPSKQSARLLSGETTKLVVENYLRSLIFGCKHISETLPKLLTLWLDSGNELSRNISKEVPEEVREKCLATRPRMFDTMNRQVKKYGERVPTYLFYTALNQMITRIGHSNAELYAVLASIITRVVAAHPQQALWPLLAVVKSSKADRANRGVAILQELRKRGKHVRHENNNLDCRTLIQQAQRLADALLDCCNKPVDARVSNVSLSRDLRFNLQVAPCALVVPWEKMLSATLPANPETAVGKHKAFPMTREAVTIQSFHDEVLVLSSLQRPRKLTVRGSDGQRYGLLCKPKDDLRKDQRLMEFNTMINRSLKKDSESSKRRLYIRTYAVTPLNEECGVLEWVEGLKPLRDILLSTYRTKGIKVDYNLLRDLLNQASDPTVKDGHLIFSNQILPMYKPALHEWFTELFPSPDTWFAARMRYTHSCAVMSMSGHVLGLGDRHGENVSLEQGSGGVFHVDFNCLFDKGLTFEKPELVPFRLTHNMVDAFGAYGVDGPFRRSAECTMHVMRANQSALLTTLETFVYDPTADFVGSRRRHVMGVPETPKEVLDSVSSKVRGLMRGDNVPLSVAGHVDALIRQATDPRNLCAMYIGWCAFL